MHKIITLRLGGKKNIYKQLAHSLASFRETATGSNLFIVEGTERSPVIGLRYPGKKVKRRILKIERANSALWANLYDFEVVPFRNGKEQSGVLFTFQGLMKDFEENKKKDNEFWLMIQELYQKNTISKTPPKLKGMDPRFYLQVLKWIWIQEDFNYKFSWEEVGSPVRYMLMNRTGTSTRKGAGRGKFYAALLLLKKGFTFEEVKKIIPLY